MIGREGLHRSVLLDIVERSGGREPRSYISTGNVTFWADEADTSHIERRVEQDVAEVLGRSEPFFIRSVSHLARLIEADPFEESPFPDAVEQVVSFIQSPIDPEELDLPVYSSRKDICVFAATDRELFSTARLVDGRTSGPGGAVERLLGQRVTTRAWRTVIRVASDPGP